MVAAQVPSLLLSAGLLYLFYLPPVVQFWPLGGSRIPTWPQHILHLKTLIFILKKKIFSCDCGDLFNLIFFFSKKQSGPIIPQTPPRRTKDED